MLKSQVSPKESPTARVCPFGLKATEYIGSLS